MNISLEENTCGLANPPKHLAISRSRMRVKMRCSSSCKCSCGLTGFVKELRWFCSKFIERALRNCSHFQFLIISCMSSSNRPQWCRSIDGLYWWEAWVALRLPNFKVWQISKKSSQIWTAVAAHVLPLQRCLLARCVEPDPKLELEASCYAAQSSRSNSKGVVESEQSESKRFKTIIFFDWSSCWFKVTKWNCWQTLNISVEQTWGLQCSRPSQNGGTTFPLTLTLATIWKTRACCPKSCCK